MSFADHFSGIAPDYAAFRPRYPELLVDVLADRSPSTRTVWDVGCGTGQLSVALARRFDAVIATDAAAAQIDAAEPHPRVSYACAPAERSGLADHVADLVVVAQAAHWFDWPRFVAEAARVARPGALVALLSYGNHDIVDASPAILDAMQTYRDAVETFWPRGREHIMNGYRDLEMPWPAVEAPAIDMTMTWDREQLLGYIRTWSATQRRSAAEGPAAIDRLHTEWRRTWSDGVRYVVRWPLIVKLARR